MTTTNTYGRQVVVPLTNKSGGSVAAGDVVVIDTGNNDAFTTSTAGAVTGGVGVAQETIANNAVGRVLTAGYAALVNTSASVTRGNFGKTHTVVKQAVDAGASRVAGTFCQFLTGGTTPDAIVYSPDLAAAALSDPMTTRGDVIVRNASNVTARLAIGSSGKVLSSDGTDVSWQTPTAGSGLLGAKTYSTGSDTAWASSSSTTTADIDATNAAITVTIPASGAILAMVELDFTYTVDNHGGFIVLRTGSTDLQAAACISGNVTSGGIGNLTTSAGHLVAFFYVTGLTPGSLTLKVGLRRFATTTLNVYANDGTGAAGHLAGPFVMAVWAA